MATVTPARKLVHWEAENSLPDDPGSLLSDITSDSFVSTSSLQYVNSQLLAHGFTSSPGISLDGIGNKDMDKVVKCLLDMLSQRVKDMSRAEQLTTELRTLRYDHERMVSMHRSASESAANFEREVNLHKSRLATTTRTLQQTESAHKQTTAELQRTRTALQQVRATHQTELKKREKEIERMSERWNKIADAQTKLGATASGLHFNGSSANAAVVDMNGLAPSKGKHFMDLALEQSEKAREQLMKDNQGYKKMILKAVNEVQSVVSEMKRALPGSSKDVEEPVPLTLNALFPLNPPQFTTNTLAATLESLRDTLAKLASHYSEPTSSPVPQAPSPSENDLERVQEVIEKLKNELKLSQEQNASQAAETQAMFDRFAADHRLTRGRSKVSSGNADESISADITVDLMTVTARDEERGRLDVLRNQLEQEREKFTEATIKLGQERAEIEAERIKLIEEKRSWQVELMLADLPPTPATSGASPQKAKTKNTSSKMKSPQKAPAKPLQVSVGKAGSGARKTTRVGTARRRSSSSYSILTSPSKGKMRGEPAFETEVIPPPPLMTTSLSAGSLLPTSFSLPPPSPHALLPAKPALLLSSTFTLNPEPQSQLPSAPDGVDGQLSETASSKPSESSQPVSITLSVSDPPSQVTLSPNPIPKTPQPGLRRTLPFPMAKPFAPHMIHAYSPAKPSPLSRILMLGNSPNSPTSPKSSDTSRLVIPDGTHLEALMEMDELECDRNMNVGGGDMSEDEMFPLIPQTVVTEADSDDGEPRLTLAQELGISESPPESPVHMPIRPESPLREKPAVEFNIIRDGPKQIPGTTTAKGRMLRSEPPAAPAGTKRFSTTEKVKGKPKSGPPPIVKNMRLVDSKSVSSGVGVGTREKENKSHGVNASGAMKGVTRPKAGRSDEKPAVAAGKSSETLNTRTKLVAKIPGGGVGRGSGPRRVPLDSAEAPPIGRGRKL